MRRLRFPWLRVALFVLTGWHRAFPVWIHAIAQDHVRGLAGSRRASTAGELRALALERLSLSLGSRAEKLPRWALEAITDRAIDLECRELGPAFTAYGGGSEAARRQGAGRASRIR